MGKKIDSHDSISTIKWSTFKKAQVRCRKSSPEELMQSSDVVDFSATPSAQTPIRFLGAPNTNTTVVNATEGGDCGKMVQPDNIFLGRIYGLAGFPGFLYAPQALSQDLQRELVYRAVSEYCERPNATNIDLCPPKETEEPNYHESMWDLWKEESGLKPDRLEDTAGTPEGRCEKTNKRNSEQCGDLKVQVKRQKNSTKKMPAQKKVLARAKYRSFKKLSWATMGYHYDWTERSYNEDAKSSMPELISLLSSYFARTCLAHLEEKKQSTRISGSTSRATKQEPRSRALSFTASASIVNFYNTKSRMGGHRDDLELALDKPIVSISLGLPAIFLLGGKTKEEDPVIPILVRPGDVMCMGGDCRLNFHAMSNVFPSHVVMPDVDKDRVNPEHLRVSLSTFTQPNDVANNANSNELKPRMPNHEGSALQVYLQQHRVNINVRQVYPDP